MPEQAWPMCFQKKKFPGKEAFSRKWPGSMDGVIHEHPETDGGEGLHCRQEGKPFVPTHSRSLREGTAQQTTADVAPGRFHFERGLHWTSATATTAATTAWTAS